VLFGLEVSAEDSHSSFLSNVHISRSTITAHDYRGSRHHDNYNLFSVNANVLKKRLGMVHRRDKRLSSSKLTLRLRLVGVCVAYEKGHSFAIILWSFSFSRAERFSEISSIALTCFNYP
jgi:hypothetical protein